MPSLPCPANANINSLHPDPLLHQFLPRLLYIRYRSTYACPEHFNGASKQPTATSNPYSFIQGRLRVHLLLISTTIILQLVKQHLLHIPFTL